MKYKVNGAKISLIEDELLVAGAVGVHYVEFELDASWDGYDSVIAVFKNKNADKEREQLLTDRRCAIPWEVLASAGTLSVGIYALTADKVRPTLWAMGKSINEGVSSCEESAEPTPNVWQQLLDELKRIAGADPDTLKPIVEEYMKANTELFKGDPGYTPVRGKDYWTDSDKTEIVQAVLGALPNGDEVLY